MTPATVKSKRIAGQRVPEVDCDHGTTSIAVMGGGTPDMAAPGEALMVTLALMRHYEAEQCGCTAALRRKYGAA
jgi:hypothetical protein